jgi:hypothetical protein
VPELKRLAYLIVMTTSVHDIINISEQLRGIASMNSGRIAGIPLVLRRRPKKISTPSGENGKRARREKWLISIEADPEWVKAKLAKMHHDALPGNGFDEAKQIAAPTQLETSGPDWGESDDDEEQEGEMVTAPESPAPNGNGNGKATTEPAKAQESQNPKVCEWPTNLLNKVVMHYKGGDIHEYRARLTKSTVLSPDDKLAVITHWMDIYNTERTAGIEPNEAAARADADRQATKESA